MTQQDKMLNDLLDFYKRKRSVIRNRMSKVDELEREGVAWKWLQTKEEDYSNMITNLEIVINEKDKEFM